MSSRFLAPFSSCLGLQRKSQSLYAVNQHYRHDYGAQYTDKDDYDEKISTAAENFVKVLLTSDSRCSDLGLRADLSDSVRTLSWTEGLAKAILANLEKALGDTSKFGQTMKEAVERAAGEAVGFARDHPAYCTLLALGIIIVIGMPWIIEALGFTELGPAEGSFAAWWQSRYAGYVPKGSLFSYFQRLGMTWKH